MIRRRTFLRAAGGITIASLIAGCTSGSGSSGGEPSSVDDWLSEMKNYDGAVTDKTGTDAVAVAVGPEGNEFVFAPAAIEISPGTTVTWEWTGQGTHNVVATDEQFKSGSPESSATYQHTFETSGTYYYYCAPHKSMGMKGVVVVTGSGN